MVSQECKELLKSMLAKEPEKRAPLIDVMNLDYFVIDDSELEELIEKARKVLEESKLQEESKQEKQWEDDILSTLHIANNTASAGSNTNKSSKTGSSNKTPGSSSKGSTFGSHVKSNNKTTKPTKGKKI